MGRLDRLILLLLVIAITGWRLTRYLRLGMAKRRSALGVAGGWFPTSFEISSSVATDPVAPNRKTPLPVRLVVAAVGVAIWLVGNLLIWLFLLESPFLKNVPPMLLGIAGIFANFYLIPFARVTGKRCGQRMQSARVKGG
jgi:hypothetical protein